MARYTIKCPMQSIVQGLYYNLVLAQQLNETTTAIAPGQDNDMDTPG